MQPPQRTKLGNAAAAQGKPAEPSRFQKAASAVRVLEPFVIPRLNLSAVMTLVPHYRTIQIEGDLIAEMDSRKIPLNETNETTWESERAARFLAEAVLDPEEAKADRFVPIGDLADWRSLDDDVIGDCWRIYADVRAAHDPIAQPLTVEEVQAIEEIIKKKEESPALRLRILRLFGVRRLSSYLLTLADPQSSLVTPSSSPSGSSVSPSEIEE